MHVPRRQPSVSFVSESDVLVDTAGVEVINGATLLDSFLHTKQMVIGIFRVGGFRQARRPRFAPRPKQHTRRDSSTYDMCTGIPTTHLGPLQVFELFVYVPSFLLFLLDLLISLYVSVVWSC